MCCSEKIGKMMNSEDLERYYQEHWAEIEPERMARYEAMFQWRDGHEALIAPAGIREGQRVVDYGCGPGALSVELARRVGPRGKIFALDINREFLARTDKLASEQGFSASIETRQVDGEALPLEDGCADRVICKNVLEYVPDPAGTLREFHRVLKAGGIAHVSDSDWGMVLLEPLGEAFSELMEAAGIAFRTPMIGRRLYGLFREAGFQDVKVQVLVSADTEGALRPVLHNMAGYARTSGRMNDEAIHRILEGIDRAIQKETYLAVLPQFLVTGVRQGEPVV